MRSRTDLYAVLAAWIIALGAEAISLVASRDPLSSITPCVITNGVIARRRHARTASCRGGTVRSRTDLYAVVAAWIIAVGAEAISLVASRDPLSSASVLM